MNRPRLPPDWESKLPADVLRLIYAYTPKFTKPSPPRGLQRALESLQKSPKRATMDLYGLGDFVLN